MSVVDPPPSEDTDFDESFYLLQYPDVARTVGPGGWESGLQHYLLHGRREGRLARPPSSFSPSSSVDLQALREEAEHHRGAGFLTPRCLSLSEDRPLKIAMVGSCMLREWDLAALAPGQVDVDLYVVNFLAALPEKSADELASYDFAVIQIPLRGVMGDSLLWHLDYDDLEGHRHALEECRNRIESQLTNWMRWNREHGLLTFVTNFFVPQGNSMGRLLPRYDLRNPQFFIEQLNVEIERVVRQSRNAYLFDVDRLVQSVGRRQTQDDVVALFGHNSFLGLDLPIDDRIEPVAHLGEYYPAIWLEGVRPILFAELRAMYRTVRQVDLVKLVVVDLDDTLWKGVSGEMVEFDAGAMTEGWPVGFAEALMYLRKRGILLAIISKNDEARVRTLFPALWGQRILLEHFAAVSINWRPKVENMREILATMNILPGNVVFIDDNPAERESMAAAFPEMRILGRHVYWLRRLLLWSSETEVPTITPEATNKTEMMQRQFVRETQRKAMSREDFLASAAPDVQIFEIGRIDDPRFSRVFELLNKTNQFNTTGKRWKVEELVTFRDSGGRILAFSAADAFTKYGLVGVVLVRAARIEQWVMSCRVLGYDMELAVMQAILPSLRARAEVVTGALIDTPANQPCRSLFATSGFERHGEEWLLAPGVTAVAPAHVSVTLEGVTT